MTNEQSPLRRCAAGAPCVEVSSRLVAAEVAEYEHGFPEPAERLRAKARRWAELHRHGAPPLEDDAG
jgi:hypothetical protein